MFEKSDSLSYALTESIACNALEKKKIMRRAKKENANAREGSCCWATGRDASSGNMYLGVSGRGGQARLCWMFVMTCLVFTFLCVIEPAHAAGASQTREVPPDPAPILFPRARGASSELQPTQLTPTSSEPQPQPQPQQPQHQTKEEEQPQHPPTQQPQSLPSLPSELLPPKLPESTDTRVAGSISPERFDKLIQYPKIKPKEGPSGFYGRPPPLPRCDSIPFPLREKVHYEFSYAEHLGIDALHNDNAVNVKESVIQARDPFKGIYFKTHSSFVALCLFNEPFLFLWHNK